MAYFRKLGPTDKNCERSHILSKVFFFFFPLLCIFLGAVYMGQGSSFSLLPHCYQCSPTQTPLPTDLCIWCISDMVSVKTTREPGEAKTFKYNNNNTYCVQRLCLFFYPPWTNPVLFHVGFDKQALIKCWLTLFPSLTLQSLFPLENDI